MAKGNLLLGYGRGKVGSLVFSRRKGEQIVRARNTAPANPRTNAQLTQRMKMYAPVKLYRQSMAQFFKYAFPVKSHETIFNAYMRENIALAPWVSRDLVSQQAPVPFPARMSAGGLSSIPTIYENQDLDALMESAEYEKAYLCKQGSNTRLAIFYRHDGEATTIGEVSSALLESFPFLRNGDQITFVMVGTAGLSIEAGLVVYDGASNFEFKYAKFVIDTESTALISSVGFASELVDAEDNKNVLFISGGNYESSDDYAGCVIVTRNSGSSVDASNSQLTLSAAAQETYNLMRTTLYRDRAATSYRVTDDAYLNPATTTNE